MRYQEWYRERRRAAKAQAELANPTLARRRAKGREKYRRRRAHVSQMESAFLDALRQRVGDARPCDRVLLPVGRVLVNELAQVLQALKKVES